MNKEKKSVDWSVELRGFMAHPLHLGKIYLIMKLFPCNLQYR